MVSTGLESPLRGLSGTGSWAYDVADYVMQNLHQVRIFACSTDETGDDSPMR